MSPRIFPSIVLVVGLTGSAAGPLPAQEPCPAIARPRGDWGPVFETEGLRHLMPPAFYHLDPRSPTQAAWNHSGRDRWVFYGELLAVRWGHADDLREGVRLLQARHGAQVAGRLSPSATDPVCVLKFPGVHTLAALDSLSDSLRRIPGILAADPVRAARYAPAPDSNAP